jgi:FKBP-type peptidyl-prolyl cis-trans isomerase
MRERLLQTLLGFGCVALLAATAGVPTSAPTTQPSTRPTTAPIVVPTPAPAVEKHQPVPPPPLPASAPPAPESAPVVVPAVTSRPAPVVVAPTTQPGPIPDQVAYGMGYAAGARIRARLIEDGRPADDMEILSGVIAGLGNHDPAFSRDEIQARFAEFQAYSLQRRAEKQYADDPGFRKLADDNMQRSRALMAQNAELANVQVLADGVQREVIKPGTGRVIDNAKILTVVNLKVSLADGTLLKATEPGMQLKLAVADCLPALIDASRGMKVGGVWRVLIPPEKAYGLAGKPPLIGPNESVEYEIELFAAE